MRGEAGRRDAKSTCFQSGRTLLNTIDTLIVARDRLFREGFAQIVGTDFAVVGAATLDQALAEIGGGLRPRLLIVAAASINFDSLQRVRSELPTIKTVVLLDPDQAMSFTAPAQCDIDGYVLSDVSPKMLRLSLGLILAGQSVMPSGLASAMFRQREAAAAASDRSFLTERESEVLRALSRGLSNKEIAREINMSASTVKVHLKAVLRKLQVSNRTEAAVWAINQSAA
jgi:two-component system nitrate/nitrite response regulator NarL